MRIPRKFRYLGIDWTVREVQQDEIPDKLGATDFQRCEILINRGVTQKVKENTFLHEFLHVIVWSMGLDRALQLTDKNEETMVNMLANGLFAAIEAKVINV